MKEYVSVSGGVVFKSRFGKWYFVDHKRPGERLGVDENSARLLLRLFAGKTTREMAKRFDITPQNLSLFLNTLKAEGVIQFSSRRVSSTDRCCEVEPPLDSVDLLITNACNLRCIHCYMESGRKMAGEMSGSEWISVLEQARHLGAFAVNISGGEPLLHPDFFRIAEYLASTSTFNANLNTNGTLIRRGDEGILARAFSSVQVSIDDAVAQRHDAFRSSRGCFNKATEAIERLVGCGIETNIGFSLMEKNLLSLDGVVELCERLGVTTLNIGLVADMGRANSNQLVTLTKDGIGQLHQTNMFIDALCDRLRQLAQRNTVLRILLPFRVQPDEGISNEEKTCLCDGDNNQILYIMPDGTTMPCDKLPTHLFGCGNARTQALIDIWTSEKMRSFKLMNPRELPRCRNCPHFIICGGACVARAFQTGGSLFSPDWTSCLIAQKFATRQKGM